MTPKQEAEKLMNEMLPVAKKMLLEYGEFYPYGGYLKPDGNIVHVGAEDSATDRPRSKDLIAILQNCFGEKLRNDEIKAATIVYDVSVALPNSGQKSDAIQVCVDHVKDYSVEVFFPYSIVKGNVEYGEIFAQQGSFKAFGNRN